MTDDAGAAAATASASQPPQPQVQSAGNTAGVPTTVWTPPPAAETATAPDSTAAGDDQDAGALLADAVSRSDDDADSADGDGDDLAAQLKKAQADYARLQRQSRTWETRAKENAAKAKDFDAYTESQKTEQQKLADRAAEAEKRASDAEVKYLRTMAAAAYDLPVNMIDRLSGATEDEINASAEQLAAAINERAEVLAAATAKANGNGQPPPRLGTVSSRPVESLRPAGLPASDNKPPDMNAWIRGALQTKK